MPPRHRPVTDRHGHVELAAVLADDASWTGPRPTVLVVHGAEGRSDAQLEFADRLVTLGHRALAVDLFGVEVSAAGPEALWTAMTGFFTDREALRSRLRHVVDTAAGLVGGDPARIAAIGFCFGGTCVLDLARIGAPVRGVVSFHGVLTAPEQAVEPQAVEPQAVEPMDVPVLVLHGWDDPFAPPHDVEALTRELSARRADWQLTAFGGVQHSFMAPAAQFPERGIVYDARAAARAWRTATAFLADVLEPGPAGPINSADGA